MPKAYLFTQTLFHVELRERDRQITLKGLTWLGPWSKGGWLKGAVWCPVLGQMCSLPPSLQPRNFISSGGFVQLRRKGHYGVPREICPVIFTAVRWGVRGHCAGYCAASDWLSEMQCRTDSQVFSCFLDMQIPCFWFGWERWVSGSPNDEIVCLSVWGFQHYKFHI